MALPTGPLAIRVVRSLVFLSLLLLLLLSVPAAAVAQARSSVHDTQLWTQVLATVSVSERWLAHLEGQSRWADDVSDHDQAIVRTAVGRRLSPRLTLWGGHAWTPRTRGDGTLHEQRLWQQLSATLPAASGWTPSLRLRLEQRFLDTWSDNSHRLRVMGRVVRPIDAAKVWSIATWNEVMVTFDDTDHGPAQGLDQNRLFAGVMRKLSPHASLETGYLWQTANPPGLAPRTHNHIAFAWPNLTF
jgi:hypothetical protein